MSRRFSDRRRAAFLRALGECGNQTLAAERAKVSRSWACGWRRRDPAFDAACREAIAGAKALLRAQGDAAPRGWRYFDGCALVVRGTGGAGGGKRVQVARARLHQWDGPTEWRFLAALAATCNVKAALAECGMTKGSAYTRRKRLPRFAQAWERAVAEGYARIEAGLVAAAIEHFDPEGEPPEVPMRGMTVADAIHLLHMHKHAVKGLGRAPGVRQRRA